MLDEVNDIFAEVEGIIVKYLCQLSSVDQRQYEWVNPNYIINGCNQII